MDYELEKIKVIRAAYNIGQIPLVCRLNSKGSENVDIERALDFERLLEGLILKILQCLETINVLLRKLLSGSVTEGEAIEMLAGVNRAKMQVEALYRRNRPILRTYDGLMSYYLFLNVCRAQKYSLMDTLGDYFEKIAFENQSGALTRSSTLICVVSGEGEETGTILNANSMMKEFFSMNEEKILHKSLNISMVMPKCIG